MKDFPHLQRNPTKLSFVACPVHGTKLKNCSSELFLINVVGNQQRSCSRRTAPITVASQPEASTKTKDKRDLWLSAMIAVAPLFSSLEDWTIYTHRKPVWRSEIYRCFKSGLWCSDLQFLWRIPTSAFPRVPPAKGNRRCLRFQTPDLQLQIQDEDLTYV